MSHVVTLDLRITDLDTFFGVCGQDNVYDVIRSSEGETHDVWRSPCVASFALRRGASWRVGIQQDGTVRMESMDSRQKLMGLVTRYNEKVTRRAMSRQSVRPPTRRETVDEVIMEFEV